MACILKVINDQTNTPKCHCRWHIGKCVWCVMDDMLDSRTTSGAHAVNMDCDTFRVPLFNH